MKVINYLCAFLASFFVVACHSDINPQYDKGKLVSVSLSINGDVSVDGDLPIEKSLSRVAGNDLIGVQVYYKSKEDRDPYKPFAYGLFDDLTSAQVSLYDNMIYKVEATTVANGKNLIAQYSSYNYRAPFTLTGSADGAPVTNAFVRSSTISFGGLSVGASALVEGTSYKSYTRPNTDRCWGQVVGFTPTGANAIAITTKRVIFGVRFITEGLSEGALHITITGSPIIVVPSPDATSRDYYITMQGSAAVAEGWIGVDYSETVSVDVKWVKGDGVQIPVNVKNFTFKRGRLYPITVKLRNSESSKGFTVDVDNSSLIEELNQTITQ
ncbi:MAG: hypothetical protein RR066_01275 [Mucinivorans sp.]